MKYLIEELMPTKVELTATHPFQRYLLNFLLNVIIFLHHFANNINGLFKVRIVFFTISLIHLFQVSCIVLNSVSQLSLFDQLGHHKHISLPLSLLE